jgi:hypothetical protein
MSPPSVDPSKLIYWRLSSLDSSGKIRTRIVRVDPNAVYEILTEVRNKIQEDGGQFLEARPMTYDELRIAFKIEKCRETRRKLRCQPSGRKYNKYRWLSVAMWLIVALSALAAGMIVYKLMIW